MSVCSKTCLYKIIFYVDRFQHTDISLLVCKQTIQNCKQTIKNYNDRFQHTNIKYLGMFQPVIINIFWKKNIMTGFSIPA